VDVFKLYALETMNDLGALVMYVKSYRAELNEQSIEVRVVSKAEELGLVKNGELNV
jgi:hypothetical protein